MGKKGDEQFLAWHSCWCHTDWFEYFTICSVLGFSRTTISRVYKEWCKKRKKKNNPICGSPVGENALLMLEVRGKWAD